jgi:DNA-binding MarR family transcriptional regulator
MLWGGTPDALSARFSAVAQRYIADGPAERADRAKRNLLAAVAQHEPATLNQVAKSLGRGAPAVSRAVDALVRAGCIERTADPNNRRRLAMRLTESGREMMAKRPKGGAGLFSKLERLAPSELRAVERAIEILERS